MAHPLSFMFDSERATAADVWVKIQALNPSVHHGILIDVMLEWARDKMQQGNPFASVYVDFCHAEIARQAASVTGFMAAMDAAIVRASKVAPAMKRRRK